MSGRSMFGAGVRTVGVYFLAQAVYDLVLLLPRLQSPDPGWHAPLPVSVLALVARLVLGAGLLAAAPMIVVAVYGRLTPSDAA